MFADVVLSHETNRNVTFARIKATFQRLFHHRTAEVDKWKETQYKVCYNPYTLTELILILKIKSMRLIKNRNYVKNHQQCRIDKDNFNPGKFTSYLLVVQSNIG